MTDLGIWPLNRFRVGRQTNGLHFTEILRIPACCVTTCDCHELTFWHTSEQLVIVALFENQVGFSLARANDLGRGSVTLHVVDALFLAVEASQCKTTKFPQCTLCHSAPPAAPTAHCQSHCFFLGGEDKLNFLGQACNF